MLPLKNAIFQTEAVLGKVKWRCNPKKNTVHRCVLLNLPFFPDTFNRNIIDQLAKNPETLITGENTTRHV